ncbi:hypothetical protein [Hoeflea sp.]|uniref:hypothetical protein n=1 Tax=Hoeflea sp. TaxID=1940281 RepID=UPI0025BD2E39|nr:hypothetical protein [Hoeflea sp.]
MDGSSLTSRVRPQRNYRSPFNRAKSREMEAGAIAFAKDNGVTVIELDQDTKAAFRDIMQPAAISWLKDNVDTPALIDEAVAAAKAAE